MIYFSILVNTLALYNLVLWTMQVSLVEDNNNEIPTSGNINIHEELPHVPGKESNEGHAEDSWSGAPW